MSGEELEASVRRELVAALRREWSSWAERLDVTRGLEAMVKVNESFKLQRRDMTSTNWQASVERKERSSKRTLANFAGSIPAGCVHTTAPSLLLQRSYGLVSARGRRRTRSSRGQLSMFFGTCVFCRQGRCVA